MQASNAAAELIDQYKNRKKRLGSQTKAPEKPRRKPPKAALLILLVPLWWTLPEKGVKGYASITGKPLRNATITLTSTDGNQYKATTDQNGDFQLSLPKDTYTARSPEASNNITLRLYPGRQFNLPFLPKKNK